MRAALSTLFQCSGYLETLAAGFSSTAKRFHFEPICDPSPLEPPSSPLALKRTPADWIKTRGPCFREVELAIMPLRLFCLVFSLQNGCSSKKSPVLGPKSFRNAVPVLWPDSGHKTGTALSSVINAVPILWPESGHENGTTNTNKIGTRIGLGAARTHPKTEKRMRADANLLAQCPCQCNANRCGNKRV